MSCLRRHSRSPATAPLDDENLLFEILLRLPPQPSSLPRASAVCRRWRLLVSDPGFSRRFRIHHRRNPPLLGFFDSLFSFVPTLEAPNRVPSERFSLQHDDGRHSVILGCRHGLVLVFLASSNQILVWDSLTADQHRIAVPPGFERDAKKVIQGAVLRGAAGEVHLRVVLTVVDYEDKQRRRALARVYSSEAGVWGDLISTLLPAEASAGKLVVTYRPAVLVGNSFYWFLAGRMAGILEFDLERQSLAVILVPIDFFTKANCDICLTRSEDGGLGFLFLLKSDCTAQLWNWKTDCHGVASWVLGRSFEVDKLPLAVSSWVLHGSTGTPLYLNLEKKRLLLIMGFAEDNNVVFLWTAVGLFMIHLESFQFKKLLEIDILPYYHPFESVYIAETVIHGGHDGADLLHNT